MQPAAALPSDKVHDPINPQLSDHREDCDMTIKVGDRLPNATFTVMTAGWAEAEDHRRGLQGQEGRAVRRAGRLHADLPQQSPAGLRQERRRDQGQGRRHHRGHRRQRRLRHGRLEEGDRRRTDRSSSSPTAAPTSPRRSTSPPICVASGLGVRSQRYAMLVEDGVVKTLNVEDAPGKAEVSSADNLLKQI